MLKEQILNALAGLINERITWINLSAIIVSFANIEMILKILIYIVSIIASILVSRKYYLESRKLKKELDEEVQKPVRMRNPKLGRGKSIF